MDFSVLSRYDDMLASYFVDSLYLWYDTLRMNSDFVGTTVDKKEVVDRIRQHIVGESFTNKAVKDATESFLEMPYFKGYTKDLSSKQLVEFTQHMKRYLFMYRPNAGFEVGSTTRYTGKPEACILATKDWKAGEQVTCCLGSIAALSEQDDLKLKSEGRDFSVMVSTRKKCSCLFLGPARFMNHDCDSNCEFILIGQNAITFRVQKDIAQGEEMTVFYAEHYFGENNCECLCYSCERLQQGHFSFPSSEENNTTADNSDSEPATPDENNTNRRSGRKRKEISYKDYYVPEQVKKTKPIMNSDISKSQPAPLIEITNTDIQDNFIINEKPIIMKKKQLFCDDEGTTTETIVRQPQTTDSWIYMPAEADPRNYVDTQEQFNMICKEQAWARRMGAPVPGEHILLPNPPLLPHAFIPIPNQSTKEDHFTLDKPDYHLRVRNNSIDDQRELANFYEWVDDLSEMSSDDMKSTGETQEYRKSSIGENQQFRYDGVMNENRCYSKGSASAATRILTCCPNAKKYCMTRISERLDMCGRCNRHYQIYGLRWPMRKIRKPTWRMKKAQEAKAAAQSRPISPTLTKNQDIQRSLSSSPVQDRRTINTAHSRSSITQVRTILPAIDKSPISSAVPYDSDPVVICAWPSNLSIPTIHNNNVSIHQRERERALAMELQEKLDKAKIASQMPRRLYKPVCLNTEIEERKDRVNYLMHQKLHLQQLKDQMEEEIEKQQQRKRQQQRDEIMKQQVIKDIIKKQREQAREIEKIGIVPTIPLPAIPLSTTPLSTTPLSTTPSSTTPLSTIPLPKQAVVPRRTNVAQQEPMRVSYILQPDPVDIPIVKTKLQPIKREESPIKPPPRLPEQQQHKIRTVATSRPQRPSKKSRKGCPIAPPLKEPYSAPTAIVTTKKVVGGYRDAPPPRLLPPPTLANANNNNTESSVPTRRCSTVSNIGPFVPIEPNNC